MELVHASPLVKGGDGHADCNMVDIGGGNVVVDPGAARSRHKATADVASLNACRHRVR